MSDSTNEAATLSGPPVRSDLVTHVRDAVDALESLGDAPGSAARATELLRATRETVAALKEARASADQAAAGRIHGYRSLLHRILEAAARRPVRLAFHATPFAREWTDLLIESVLVSDYAVGPLFFSRARSLGDRTLFLLPADRKDARISWVQAEQRVLDIGRALLALRARAEIDVRTPVAMLGGNSPELALFDLACLATGTVNVPIPASSPPSHVQHIVAHAKPGAVFLGDDQARHAITAAAVRLPRVHWLDGARAPAEGVVSFEDFLVQGQGISDDEVRIAAAAVRCADLATTMYTSGTTGIPKAVPFTHGNLVTKRFARAAAWPDLGEGDVFLCYLPLYHTFGRWLEMLGCVFWGSVYAFVEDVSVESLLWSFQRVRPTTFISVPKKWMQIAEAVAPLAAEPAPDPAHDREVARALQEATGGRLKRGLSAAGYMSPLVFRRFHAAGIELHSGFGMTEATGGVTMTPAGDYRDDSIGVALPGIELKIADDGELLIRGPYVTAETPDEPPREDGWLASGDIVAADAAGHLRIIDRKKEIFKNVQGETISPRRVESLFGDFEAVERVLLVGDGREYCTVLIVPRADLREAYGGATGATIESPELREIFAPIVSTVNRFLAPYERIVDFAILSRDLDRDRGELTAKGTPKRKLLAERFRDVIEPMYSRESISLPVGDVVVRIPHWFLRQTGIHTRELRAAAGGLEVATSGRTLGIRSAPEAGVAVGELVYQSDGPELLLGEIFGRAELWLGNEEVRRFAGPGIEHWWRRGRRFKAGTRLAQRPLVPEDEADSLPRHWASDTGLDVGLLHELARSLRHPDVEVRRGIVELLRESPAGERPDIDALVRDVLASGLADPGIRGECLRAILPVSSADDLEQLVGRHLADATFLTERDVDVAAGAPLRPDQLDRLLERLRGEAEEIGDISRVDRLVRWLLRHAIEHRDSHLQVRSALAALADEVASEDLRTLLRDRLGELVHDFRAKLPRAQLQPGVSWGDAVVFAKDVDASVRPRILGALAETTLLAEAKTLLGPSPTPALPVLGHGSVRISFLGTGTGRTVHLLEWSGAGAEEEGSQFECILKVNHELGWEDVQRELRVAVRVRTGAARPIVKTHGGGYREYDLWTEEYIPGLTLDRLVDRLAGEPVTAGPGDAPLPVPGGRLPEVWPFLMTTCASLVIEFWKRTGRKWRLANPNPAKVVLPEHDWQVGGRLVSVADRVPCQRLTDVLESIHVAIVRPLAERHPEAVLPPTWALLFAAALEVLGEKEGLEVLETEAPWISPATTPAAAPEALPAGERLGPAALRFVSSVKRRGFLPTRTRAAAHRWRRWEQINPQATLEAQAATLDQLEDAYGLHDLEAERSGTRLQLFRHTVFRGAPEALAHRLDDLIARTVSGAISGDEWRVEVAKLREKLVLDDRQEFLLARMVYPHVDPRSRAVLVREQDPRGGVAAGVEVEYRDPQGEVFRIRRPANPNETNALVRIFRASNFRRVPTSPEHDLLVVTEELGRVIGGLIFRRASAAYVVLEWIVVSRQRRGRNIGSVLMRDFLERLKVEGVKAVTTGFFRPTFFAKFGFRVDPRYAGIVKLLTDEDAGESGVGAPPIPGEDPRPS